jgi:hypothetical protein
LEIGQETLTDRRILCAVVPEAERVFAARVIDAERHHDAVLTDVDAVDEQSHEIERVARGRSPGRELRRGLRDEAAAHGALARTACVNVTAHWLQAAVVLPRGDTDEHLLHDRRFSGSVSANARNVGSATASPSARTRGRRICTFRPPRTTSLGTVPARDAVRSA